LGLLVIECTHNEERRAAGAINRQWRNQQMSIVERLKMSKEPQLPALSAEHKLPERPLSRRAAEMHDYVTLMEEKLAEMESRARIAESLLEKERRENTYLLNSRDSLLRDNAQLATLLASMSDLIDRARAIKSLPAQEEPPPVEALLKDAVIATGEQQE
jgi:hypothetical protein